MDKIIKKLLENKFLITVLILGGILRFVNLGHSDFQGDEIKALYLPEEGQEVTDYLIDQRKGPLQFTITYLLKFADPLYQNQFLIRLPFAIAGFISIYYFYKLIKDMFGKKAAFYASFLFATNGFLIAFSRIVQYQSFVIMFMIGALYFLRKKNIYMGLIFWALSVLAHYDGLFIFPLAFYYIYQYLVELNGTKLKINGKHFLHFFIAGIISLALLASFYIPFIQNISSNTQSYWLGRITGEASDKISSSMYLFTVYQPIYVIHIYLALFTLGISTIIAQFIKSNKYTKKIGFINKLIKNFPTFENSKELIATGIWFLIAIIVMEVLIYIPGTHIYVYIIPATIFCALGIILIETLLNKIIKIKNIAVMGIGIIFTFIALQMYALFIDNNQEYPWEEEKFLIWTFPRPTPAYHLSMFGFPYFRNWEGLKEFIESYPKNQAAYSTNERTTISRHFITLPKESNLAGFYIYIRNPQSFENVVVHQKVSYWMSKYKPIYVYSKNGINMVEIYLMEPGGKEVIIDKGF